MSERRASSGFDSQKGEAFAGRMLSALNNGAFCLMASVGHRTGLFDAMRDQPPMASGDIAVRAGLNERYVREWLGAMVTAHILSLVPGLVDQLALGIRTLDVGCGQGRIIIRLAELFPNSNFAGMDLSAEAIAAACNEASAKGLRNVEFVAIDLSDFHQKAEPESFAFITTFDAVHDQAAPCNVLKGIHRALRRDGVYLMQDIKGSSHVYNNTVHPLGTFLYAVSCMHCMTVSLAQGGEGLGAMWGEEKTREYLERAGFRSVEKHELAHDITNNWYVVRK